MDVLALHDRGLRWMEQRIAAIDDDQWDGPTPCTEWDVRTLVNHNVFENFWAAELGKGSTIDDVGDAFDGDLLGDDPLGAYRESARRAAEAFQDTEALTAPIAVSYGPIPGEEYLRHRILDLVVHSWDIARATGQDTTIEPELLQAAATIADEEAEMIRVSGVFATDVDPPLDADRQTRLLALTGRRP